MSIVVDAHQHFWDPTHRTYPWMTEDFAHIRHPLGPDDLRPLLRETGVDYTVLVQTLSSLDETNEFLRIAADTDFIAGVVGWVDLTDPQVAATLRELKAARGGEKLVGIRHQVHDEPDAAWLVRADVQRGLEAVAEAGLAYDLLVRTRELPAAHEVVSRFPRLSFVVDHLAKPPIKERQIDAWAEALAPFSEYPNVSCKLSGMVTEADWQHWRVEDLVPYVQRVLAWFGEDRLLFGSDWPVCLLVASYRQVFDAYQEALGNLRQEARDKIFGGNAITFYRLDQAGIPR